MCWNVIEASWEHYHAQIKAQWGNLSNDDLEVIAGKREKLLDKIQQAYCLEQGEADKQVSAFEKYLRATNLA